MTFSRFAQLDIIPSVQPIHATQDMLHCRQVLGGTQPLCICVPQPVGQRRQTGLWFRRAGGDPGRDPGHSRGGYAYAGRRQPWR